MSELDKFIAAWIISMLIVAAMSRTWTQLWGGLFLVSLAEWCLFPLIHFTAKYW